MNRFERAISKASDRAAVTLGMDRRSIETRLSVARGEIAEALLRVAGGTGDSFAIRRRIRMDFSPEATVILHSMSRGIVAGIRAALLRVHLEHQRALAEEVAGAVRGVVARADVGLTEREILRIERRRIKTRTMEEHVYHAADVFARGIFEDMRRAAMNEDFTAVATERFAKRWAVLERSVLLTLAAFAAEGQVENKVFMTRAVTALLPAAGVLGH